LATTWLPQYIAQYSDLLPIEIAGVSFFQIKAEVVNNSMCTQFIDDMLDGNEVLYLLTRTDGAGVGLHFPGYSTFLI
jgi:hypothetical protein